MSFEIARGQANTVILTLKEKATLANPYYLFSLTSRLLPGNNKTFIAQDISLYTYRYNEFVITESTTESLLTGTVTLEAEGFWDYTIYEQSSSTNLDVANATGIVETGMCRVTGSAISPTKHVVDVPERKAHKVT